jgi:DNA topoisomerase-1
VFDGHARISGINIKKDEQELPAIEEADVLDCREISPTQHFTQPSPRFTEATLVKTLEKEGIGRPSTYAPIITTIQDRGYVELTKRRFYATDLGILVTDLLVGSFPSIVDSEFTSKMEEQLDQIEESEMDWRAVLSEFYTQFSGLLDEAQQNMPNLKENPEKSDLECEKCSSPMVYLWNIHGRFLGCSSYPECRNTKSIRPEGDVREEVETEHVCEKCDSTMVLKEGRNGRFLACSGYPKCKTTYSVDEDGNPIRPKETEHKCEKCSKAMVLRTGRRGPFLACSGYPACRNTRSVDQDGNPVKAEKVDETCDKCKKPMAVKSGRRGKFLACTGYPECKNTAPYKGQEAESAGIDCDKCGKVMVVRSGRRGSFVACSGYPDCRNTKPLDEVKALKKG